jgi:hypothetical protein
MAAWTEAQNKKLGWFYFVVAVLTLIIAFVIQPFADWDVFAYVLAIAVALLGVVGLWQGLTGKGNTRSRNMTDAKQRQWAIFGLIAVTLAVIFNILGSFNDWTASDILSIGVWVAISGLFISQIRTLGKS